MKAADLAGTLAFLRRAEQLKNTLRSAHTSQGRVESVAEHTWRLCLMAMLFAKHFPEINFERLVKMCIVHDLGEAIRGDIPAPEQDTSANKADEERADLLALMEPLPTSMQDEILDLWDAYEAARSPEARLAKALDKLETILQHNQGQNPADFDYRFNLAYGRRYTTDDPLIARIRTILDAETEARAAASEQA